MALAIATARICVAQSGGATVSGSVRDSIAHHALAGAMVQIVPADGSERFRRTVSADSLGHYVIGGVPSGRYLLAFFHPLLDSLGVEASPHEVVVDSPRGVSADLATPSAARIRDAICGSRSSDAHGAVVIGVVRDAVAGAPLPNAEVAGEWVELTLSRARLGRQTPRVVAKTRDNGWFSICGVPSPGTITLVARRGADSTGRIEVDVPPDGLLRRELFVGGAATGQLRGVVVSASGERPIAGARVSIMGGPETRTNERGEWAITASPAGTRLLDVHAISFYPERRAVDVLPDGAPVRVALSSYEAVLDTMKVRARERVDTDYLGFTERRRSGNGRYLGPEDIAPRAAINASDVFRNTLGVRYDRQVSPYLQVHGIRTDWCAAAVFVDGHWIRDLTAEDLDGWVQPDEIAGIEIYDAVSAPAQFHTGAVDCGAIVVWTRPTVKGPRKGFREYVMIGAGIAGIVFVSTRLLR